MHYFPHDSLVICNVTKSDWWLEQLELVWLSFTKLLQVKKFVIAWKGLHWFSGTTQKVFRNFNSVLCGYDTALYCNGDGSFSREKSQAW